MKGLLVLALAVFVLVGIIFASIEIKRTFLDLVDALVDRICRRLEEREEERFGQYLDTQFDSRRKHRL